MLEPSIRTVRGRRLSIVDIISNLERDLRRISYPRVASATTSPPVHSCLWVLDVQFAESAVIGACSSSAPCLLWNVVSIGHFGPKSVHSCVEPWPICMKEGGHG